jgi:hypothetical protein
MSALNAQALSPWCSGVQRVRVAARAPPPPKQESEASACSTSEQVFDPLGCLLAGTSGMGHAFGHYYRRVLDLDARLRLVATARWLAAQSDAGRAQRFAGRPAAIGALPFAVATFDPNTQLLWVPTAGRKADDVFTIALPGSRHPGAPPTAR